MFGLYLELGFEHILDFKGYDHIIFLISICAVYLFNDWKKVLILVTAFTIGHSLTLALATLNIFSISTDIIEFLIPLTIFISALFVIFIKNKNGSKRQHQIKYLAAMFFGLIHGLGFSNYLKAILGKENDLIIPLFAFNIGLEIGQIITVALYLLLATIIVVYFRVVKREFELIIAGAVGGISLLMIIERYPF